jgi:hypothetical protein
VQAITQAAVCTPEAAAQFLAESLVASVKQNVKQQFASAGTRIVTLYSWKTGFPVTKCACFAIVGT